MQSGACVSVFKDSPAFPPFLCPVRLSPLCFVLSVTRDKTEEITSKSDKITAFRPTNKFPELHILMSHTEVFSLAERFPKTNTSLIFSLPPVFTSFSNMTFLIS